MIPVNSIKLRKYLFTHKWLLLVSEEGATLPLIIINTL
jgi:hypothetical protein